MLHTQNENAETASKRNDPQKTGLEALRDNAMMRNLLEGLEAKQDIGHYGRLTFAMIARHFLSEEELLEKLCLDPDFNQTQAVALLRQVEARDYNPPRPDRIREWQAQQSFTICPIDDSDACNVYRDLKFPDHVYENIQHYQEKKVAAETEAE